MSVFNNEELQEIDRELAHYDKRRAGCVEALKTVQRRRGWVDDEALKALADYLDMSAEELDGVASFYNLIYRRPVGRHVIHLCDSVVCWMMGYRDIAQRLKTDLGLEAGQTTADGRFTCLPASCLGACHKAPVMVVDETLHDQLRGDQLAQILERYQ